MCRAQSDDQYPAHWKVLHCTDVRNTMLRDISNVFRGVFETFHGK